MLELPSQRIPVIATNPNKLIAVWTRTIADGGRRDREGRPFVNTGLIPKTPRNSPAPDRRDAFNLALPQNDVSAFKADMVSVLTSFYARTPADASFLANAFLPDVLMFQIGNPNGYGTTIGPGPGALRVPSPAARCSATGTGCPTTSTTSR